MSFYTITPQIYVCTKNREKKKARESCHTRIPLKFVPMTCVPCLTRMNESCHTCHAYEWVMSHIWMSHGTHTNESCHTYEWGMARIWMSHGTHVNESWHTYKCVLPHIRMSHVTHTSESWHTYEWVMAHMWMRDGTHMNESRHTYECVMAHMWMRHGTHMNESWHTYEWVMAHIWMSHVSYIWMRHGTHTHESWHTREWKFEYYREKWDMSCAWMSHGAHMNAACPQMKRAIQQNGKGLTTKIWVLPRKMRHVTWVNQTWHTYIWVMAHTWMKIWVLPRKMKPFRYLLYWQTVHEALCVCVCVPT